MVSIENQTPKQLVQELDKYIVGQEEAKRSVAIAFRNRYRRQQLSDELREEVTPKNILMIGSTGIGKTEIARRLSKIVNAPFVKVEATKFTEVGYIGRDVESMVRDLVETAYKMVKKQAYKKVRPDAIRQANDRLVEALVPVKTEEKTPETMTFADMMNMMQPKKEEVPSDIKAKRREVKEQLDKGLLENKVIEISIVMNNDVELSNPMEMMMDMGDMGNMMSSIMGQEHRQTRTMTVKEAREYFIEEESEKLVNGGDLSAEAIDLAENAGIIFIDEFDKIASTAKNGANGQVSREGVQRDILPIVEGSQVKTKRGLISTDHILFIASGAFHFSKPSDLIPELQGRFPIRVELKSLTEDDFIRILTEPEHSLIKQYIALLETENVSVTFTKEAIERIAAIAYEVNEETDNIGARRLHTILEKVLEDLLFESADMGAAEITITEQYVNDKVGNIASDRDLSQYIL